jgi:hypothetical protein
MSYIFSKLKWIKNCICTSKISSSEDLKTKHERLQNLRTLDGQRMIYPIDVERELYFQQLNNVWS